VKSMWPNFVIGLDDTIDRRPVKALQKSPGISRAAEGSKNRLAVLDHLFQEESFRVPCEMVSRRDCDASISQKSVAKSKVAGSRLTLRDTSIRSIPSPDSSPLGTETALAQTHAPCRLVRATLFLAGLLLCWPRKRPAGRGMVQLATRKSASSSLTGA
jgi:hypothetical protein